MTACLALPLFCRFVLFFFFNDTATTEIYTLSLHDALPIWGQLDKGTLRVVDQNPDDNLNAYVSGCPGTPGLDPGVTIYTCKNIHFRFIGGKYAIDDGKWQPVPLLKKLVTFGVQPVTSP